MTANATVRRVLAIVIVVLLPLAVGTMYIGALAGRAASPENITAAVVNQDEMVQMDVGGKKTPMLGGRLVAAELTAPPAGSQVQLDWTLTDQGDASRGLRDGKYYAVVTIPKDFSAKLVAALQNDQGATPAGVQVQANTAASPLAGKYGQQDARYAAAEVSSQLTQQYLEGVFSGLAKMGEQTKTAQEGATKLADGSTQLASGIGQTSDGAAKLADGSSQLATGVGKTAAGATQLSSGISQLASGAGQFQSGTSQLSSGAGALARGADPLAKGVKAYTDGVSQAADGVSAMAKQSGPLVSGTKQLDDGAQGVKKLVAATGAQTATGLSEFLTAGKLLDKGEKPLETAGKILKGTLPGHLQELGSAGGGMAAALGTIAKQCQEGTVTDTATCEAATNGLKSAAGFEPSMGAVQGDLAGVGKGLADFAEYSGQAAPHLKAAGTAIGTANAIVNGPTNKQLPVTLKAASAGVAKGTAQLSKQAPALVKGIKDLNKGMTVLGKNGPALAKGTKELAKGAGQLSTGASLLSSNSGKLTSGISQLGMGANALASGIGQLKTGADGLATGSQALADGVGQLQTGAKGLASGTKEFADGLSQSTGQLPSYSESQVSSIASVITTPVQADVAKAEVRSDDGASSAAIIAIALWLGALGIFLLLRPVPRGVAYSSAGPLRLALAGFLPGAAMMAGAAILLVAVLPAAGLKMSNWFAVAVLAVLGGLVFAAVNQAARALWGRIGSLVSLAFFALQFACVGGVMPVSSAPAFFRALAPVLPMSELSSALSGPVLGTPMPGAGMQVAGMLLWGIVSLGATAWVVRRAQARATVLPGPAAGVPVPA